MKDKIKKFFFPFLAQERDVRKFLWHRFFEVFFFIFIITILVSVYTHLNNDAQKTIDNCQSVQNTSQGLSWCVLAFEANLLENFLLALLVSIIFFYVLQVIYFKIILWVIFGNSKKGIKTLVVFLGILLFGFSSNIVSAAFDKDLYYGMENENQVTELQNFLTNQNLYSGPITGNYYSLTQEAVRKFQIREGIYPAGGYFGPKTRGRIVGLSVSENKNIVSVEKSTTTDIADILSRLEILEQKLNEALKNGNVGQNTNKTNDIPTRTTSENRPTQASEARIENVVISKTNPVFAPELLFKKDTVVADGTNKIEVTIKSKFSDGTLAPYKTMKIKMPYLSEKLWVVADAYGLATVSVPVERVEKKVVLGQCGSQSDSTSSYVIVSLLDKDTEGVLVSKSVKVDPVTVVIRPPEPSAYNGPFIFPACE